MCIWPYIKSASPWPDGTIIHIHASTITFVHTVPSEVVSATQKARALTAPILELFPICAQVSHGIALCDLVCSGVESWWWAGGPRRILYTYGKQSNWGKVSQPKIQHMPLGSQPFYACIHVSRIWGDNTPHTAGLLLSVHLNLPWKHLRIVLHQKPLATPLMLHTACICQDGRCWAGELCETYFLTSVLLMWDLNIIQAAHPCSSSLINSLHSCSLPCGSKHDSCAQDTQFSCYAIHSRMS